MSRHPYWPQPRRHLDQGGAIFPYAKRPGCPLSALLQTLRSWYQRPEHARTASNSAAGVILLGTPHTVNSRTAVQFCKLISLAFLGKTLQPGDPGTAYTSELVRLCKDFEDLDVPAFSIHELLKTRLGPLKNVVVGLAGVKDSNEF